MVELNDANLTITHSADADEDKSWVATHIETLASFEGPSIFDAIAQLEVHLSTVEE